MSRNKNTPAARDIEDVSACTCANLRKAARVVTQMYDEALRPTGLRATQFTLLATLVKCGDTPLTQLAETLVMDRTTLTRNLKPLVRRELLRTELQEDQRIRKVVLSDSGQRAFEDALPRWQQVQRQMSESLGQARWSGFLDDLSATVVAAQDQ